MNKYGRHPSNSSFYLSLRFATTNITFLPSHSYSMQFTVPFFVLALASAALGGPIERRATCDVSRAKMAVPAKQTQLVAPTAAPSYILLGVGVQNYTCSSAGTYT